MRIEIDSIPPIVLAEPHVLDIGDEHAGLNGEVPNITVDIDNARGDLTSQFADPPLRARAVVSRTGVEIFAGVVQGVTLGARIQIALER